MSLNRVQQQLAMTIFGIFPVYNFGTISHDIRKHDFF